MAPRHQPGPKPLGSARRSRGRRVDVTYGAPVPEPDTSRVMLNVTQRLEGGSFASRGRPLNDPLRIHGERSGRGHDSSIAREDWGDPLLDTAPTNKQRGRDGVAFRAALREDVSGRICRVRLDGVHHANGAPFGNVCMYVDDMQPHIAAG